MKKIVTKKDLRRLDYPHDCQRIVEVLASHGYHCTLEQAQDLWKDYSDHYAAGWLILPESDEDVFYSVSSLFEELDDEEVEA
jgi:hypothetical protein